MIQNEYQYNISQSKIKELQQESIESNKTKNELHPRQFKIRQNGLEGMMNDIISDINKYDQLKEHPSFIKIDSFNEIPVALIKARIALGMTQKDLAEKLGMKEQQIQRYEANQYSSAGFQRLAEIATALDVKLNDSSLLLKKVSR